MSLHDVIGDLLDDAQESTELPPTERPTRAYRWTVLRADGDPLTVYLGPPGTATEAMSGISGAITATPDPLLTVGCATCRHLKRPGLSDGHCGARTDLPPAYGDGHPLRQLPDDRGATCATWECCR